VVSGGVVVVIVVPRFPYHLSHLVEGVGADVSIAVKDAESVTLYEGVEEAWAMLANNTLNPSESPATVRAATNARSNVRLLLSVVSRVVISITSFSLS